MQFWRSVLSKVKPENEKFSKCGFTRISNGLLYKIRSTKLTQLEHEIIWFLIDQIHRWKDAPKSISLYKVQKNISARHEIVKKYIIALQDKGFIKIVKGKKGLVIYTLQSYYCNIQNCTNCNPYSDDRICQNDLIPQK